MSLFDYFRTGQWSPSYAGDDSDSEYSTYSAGEFVDAPRTGGGYNGQKFPGGLNALVDSIKQLDYWQLRKRSESLFHTNMYARGIVRRLVTNIINTGLHLEAIPEEKILGFEEDDLEEWSENLETLFSLWADDKNICDYKGRRTFGKIQESAYTEALIGGDVLVVLRQDPVTKLTQVQLIPGKRIKTPFDRILDNKVIDGVEIDSQGRHIAFHVEYETAEGTIDSMRIPAYGAKSGRLQAWLYYGIEVREDGVRGEPLLGIAIQALSEIDSYKDSAIRKAFINSMLVGAVERGDAPSSLPMQRAAIKKGSETVGADGSRALNFAEIMPGMFIEQLAPGEKLSPYTINGADVSFGPFEAAILAGLAWALQLPPEILTLSFSHNYSASQAASGEFKIFCHKERGNFGDNFCKPIYEDVFTSLVLLRTIEANSYIEALANPGMHFIKSAWLCSDWMGAVKPSIDPVKQVEAFKRAIAEGFQSHDRSAREFNGTKWTKNIKRIIKENKLKAEALGIIQKVENPVQPMQNTGFEEHTTEQGDVDEKGDAEENEK